ARDVATTKLAVLMPGDSVFTAMQIMSDGPYSQLPVLDPDTKKLIGTLRETDVLAAYDRQVFKHGAQPKPVPQ
ncbi:MAG: CBS domain-containing protein, partial [Humidesulfovibrio sp.]|nr:CBS domain-containing protein [Humidesulfovibrio sp.]